MVINSFRIITVAINDYMTMMQRKEGTLSKEGGQLVIMTIVMLTLGMHISIKRMIKHLANVCFPFLPKACNIPPICSMEKTLLNPNNDPIIGFLFRFSNILLFLKGNIAMSDKN